MQPKHHHPLNAALYLTAAFALVELVGGLISGSLALLADAGHMISDMMALSLALLAQKIAERPAHAGMTYGYGRSRVIAAQVNGLALCFLSGWIIWEAMARLGQPPTVDGKIVVVIAAIGLIINLIVMRWLHGNHDINSKAAYWHVIGDALGSIAAIIAGLVMMWTGWMLIDPILSCVVAVILAWGGWRVLREATLELMAGVPDGVQLPEIEKAMRAVPCVVAIHHIHIWKLPNSQLSISAHVQIEDMLGWPTILPKIQGKLAQKGIQHFTLQPELDKEKQCITLCL